MEWLIWALFFCSITTTFSLLVFIVMCCMCLYIGKIGERGLLGQMWTLFHKREGEVV